MSVTDLLAVITDNLPTAVNVAVYGSATDPAELDGWSDLDLRLDLPHDVPVAGLLGGAKLWAYENVEHDHTQTCRTVLTDGRRLDLSVVGSGRVVGLTPAADNEVRFIAAMAVTKLGRGDRLIGVHLTLDLLRRCLLEAMLLRDRDTGTTVHRHGSDRDHQAERVREIAGMSSQVEPRPNIVEQACDLYGTWRAEREPGYRPDWTGLSAVISRGLGS
jgi:hypothetical protein